MTSLIRNLSIGLCVTLLAACDRQLDSNVNIDRHIGSGHAYLEQGQFNAAMIEARAAMQIDPKNEDATLLLAEIYMELSMESQAMHLLELIDGTSFDYFKLLAESYVERGKYASAILTLRQNKQYFEKHELEKLLIQARARIGLQDAESALADYEKAQKLAPNNVEVKLGLIRVNALTGSLGVAEVKLKEILADAPRTLDALLMLGGVYMRQGRMDLAEATLTDAISTLPVTDIFTHERASLLQAMIRLLAYQGRSGEALIYQKMLSDAFPNAQAIGDMMTEVIDNLQAGNFDSAIAALDEIDAIAPENETTGTLRGVVAFLQGDDSSAEDFFLENVDLEMASSKTLQMFAVNQFRLNQPHKVVAILREKVKNSTDPEVIALFAVAAWSADMNKEGEAALRKAISLAPDRVRLSVMLANYLNETNPEAALTELKRAHKVNPQDEYVRLSLLNQYFETDKQSEAAKFVRKIVADDAERYSTQLVVGSYYTRLNELDLAETAFRKAIELDAKKQNSYFGLAEIQKRKGQYDEAASTYRIILAENIDSVPAYAGLLDTYALSGQIKKGVQTLSDMADESGSSIPMAVLSNFFTNRNQQSDAELYISKVGSGSKRDRYWKQVNANIYLKKARLGLANKELDQARADVFTALSSYPANKELLSLLVKIEIAAESYGEAEKVIGQIEQIHPGSRILHLRKGDLAMATGALETATVEYMTAWNIRFGDRLGQDIYSTLQEFDRSEEAEQFLIDWRKKIPDSLVALVNFAEQEFRAGRQQEAIGIYKTYLKENKGSQLVLNNLAWLLLELDQSGEAVEVAEKAHEISPRNGSIADTYGWSLFKNGRIPEAISMLERAYKLSPDIRIQSHLDEAVRASTL